MQHCLQSHSEEIHWKATLFYSESLNETIIYKFLFERASWDSREKNFKQTDDLPLLHVCCDWYNKNLLGAPKIYRTSDLRCQVRDLTTTNSRVHALKSKPKSTRLKERRRNIFEWISGSFMNETINHGELYDILFLFVLCHLRNSFRNSLALLARHWVNGL